MKVKLTFCFICICLISSIAKADLFLSKPKVFGEIETDKVEAGASPRVTVRYQNTTGKTIEIVEANLILEFDPKVIDYTEEITNHNPANLFVNAVDQSIPGQITYKLSAFENNALRVSNNKSIDLATFVFHLRQTAKINKKIKLFALSIESSIQDRQEQNVTGSIINPPQIFVVESEIEFAGLRKLMPGNGTVIAEWSSAIDATPPVTYQLFRKTEGTDFTLIYEGEDTTFVDTGLINGTLYYYQVTAFDSTYPKPNVATNTPIMSVIPQDIIPPPDVTDPKTTIGDNLVVLDFKVAKDPDIAGIAIIKNIEKPVRVVGNLTGKSLNLEDEPFGTGNGAVMYVGPPFESIEDFNAFNGELNFYKIYTFDNAYNYSKGVETSGKAGIAPKPVSNFKAELNPEDNPQEILIYWNNSPSVFCKGTLFCFTTDKDKFDAVNKSNLGDAIAKKELHFFDLQIYGGPGDLDGVYIPFDYISSIAPLERGKTYYFKAFARNQSRKEPDLEDPESIKKLLFSKGEVASVYIPRAGEEKPTKAAEVKEEQEAAPKIKVWFGERLYSQELAKKGIEFQTPKRPRIRMEVTIEKPYSLDQNPNDYIINVDNETFTFSDSKIEKNKANFETTLPQELSSGKHTFIFSARSAGNIAKASKTALTASATVTSGPLRILLPPLAFPSPYNPKSGPVTFQFALSEEADININIFNIAGQPVKRIQFRGLGQINKVTWDGRDEQGRIISNGLYIVYISSRGRVLGKLQLAVIR
jgi:hypothetical protein